MDNLEPKKLALLRILQIFHTDSDCDHPLTQEDVARLLAQKYGIHLERKAIGRNVALLRDAGFDIRPHPQRPGNYLEGRPFEDAELRMLIDGVLCSRYITARHSADLIGRLCALSSRYFRAHVRHVCSVNDWDKTENPSTFYNIACIDEAIEQGRQIAFDYNKYALDKRLHRSASHTASPYQLLLHNQRYYLMARNERWQDITFYRLDRITHLRITGDPLTPLRSMPGYEEGLDYRELANALPYMFNDRPQPVELLAEEEAVDQIIDWFGTGVQLEPWPDGRVKVHLRASLQAMEPWALQFLNSVEVVAPARLRAVLRADLEAGLEKYR